jgi:hypothetical protein
MGGRTARLPGIERSRLPQLERPSRADHAWRKRLSLAEIHVWRLDCEAPFIFDAPCRAISRYEDEFVVDALAG